MGLKSPFLPFFRIIYTEWVQASGFSRRPEPQLLMTNTQQVQEYSDGAILDGPLLSIYLFHLPRIIRRLQPGDEVLDLGCGPSQLLCLLASLCPDVRFTGLDASAEMLKQAVKNKARLEEKIGRPISNLDFVKGSMLEIPFQNKKIDAVISDLAIHHLPSIESLSDLFREIQRVLKPGGKVYLSDLLRPHSEKTVGFYVRHSYQKGQSYLAEDFKNSMLAAYSLKELQEAIEKQNFPARLSSSPILKFYWTLSTPAIRPVPFEVRQKIREMAQAMPLKNKIDYFTFRLLTANP